MDAYYFKKQIREELDGAEEYIKRAVEIRAMNSSWGDMFVEMSSNELDHAAHLFKMFEEYYKKIYESYGDNIPKYMKDAKECIEEMYMEDGAKIRIMHEMYSK